MKFIKMIVINAVVVFASFTISTIHAQKLSSTAKPFSILLPQTVDTKNLSITYSMTGAFGGYSSFIRTKQNIWSYEIDTSYEGKTAETLKVVIYCPGYKVNTIDIPSLPKLKKWNYELELESLQTAVLSGKVLLPDTQSTEDLRLSVNFSADWECEFFELRNCLVPWSEVASADIANDGGFSVALPDFTFDPIVSSYKRPGGFKLFVSDQNSGKFLFKLKPEKATINFFQIQLPIKYPSDQVFVPVPET